ncbi:MAG: ATP-binding protein [Proteobacteria bacterium]|nr:ATP-binding protein [Pseudomonadota bacterium]
MIPHANFAVHEPSQVGAARRHAARLADALGFDDVAAGRVALVVTELGNNLVRHAQRGRLLVGARTERDVPCIEVLSLDHGPGMADVEACLADGYTSGSTPGTGLGAARRLASDFHYYSKVDQGTVILARMRAGTAGRRAADGAFSHGGVCLAAPGEVVSGDGWAYAEHAHGACLMMADGLGHGPDAAIASDGATGLLPLHAALAPGELLRKVHGALSGTRGAAVAIYALDAAGAGVTTCGAGNIAGRLISGNSDRTLLTQHGTAGVQIRQPQEQRSDWPPHALLIVHTDGLRTRWNLSAAADLVQCDVTVVAAWLIRDHCRGRDDATVVVVRRNASHLPS